MNNATVLVCISVQLHIRENARIQGSRSEEVKVYTSALWDFQDWLGLVDFTLYFLYCGDGALQCSIYSSTEKPKRFHLL